MTEPDEQPTELIHGKLAAALLMMQGVPKDGHNKAQNFKFRGIEDVAAASKKVFEALEIFVVPHMTFVADVPQPMKDGKLNGHRVILEATYTFYAEDGSFVEAQTIGEGVDSYDKATNKAMSAAFKYALMQVLCIGDPDDDGDASGEPSSHSGRVQAQPAAKAAPKHDVTADEWAAWEELRPKLLGDEQLKETLVNWIDGAKIKVERAMTRADFDKLWAKANGILEEAGKAKEGSADG